MIIGDGIQKGVEALTGFLQLHAGLHTSIALLDLSIWQDGEDRLIVVPRIPLRTVPVERGIVLVDANSTAQIKAVTSAKGPTVARPMTASEPEYYAQLELKRPDLVAPVKELVRRAVELGIEPEYRKSLRFRWHPSPDVDGAIAYIEPSGRAWLGGIRLFAEKINAADLAETYLVAVAELFDGSIRRYSDGGAEIISAAGKAIDAAELSARQSEWLVLLDKFLRSARGRISS